MRSATELAVLDAATGRKIADIGDPTRAHCVTDGYDSIVCDADETLDLYRVLDHAVTTIPTDAHAEAVIRDRVFVTTADDEHHTVDTSGVTVDLTLPGAPVGLQPPGRHDQRRPPAPQWLRRRSVTQRTKGNVVPRHRVITYEAHSWRADRQGRRPSYRTGAGVFGVSPTAAGLPRA